tara:strand:- start:3647 stop:4144 length:498 start_codon:yes stop_codon:yes gene_type:complete
MTDTTTSTTDTTETPTTATDGTTVTVHYRGTFDEDGTEFDNSRERGEPLEFVLNSGMMIRGFNDAVVGMSVGETKTITVTPTDGYGEVREDRRTEFERTAFPAELELTEGMPVPLRAPNGHTLYGRITELQETTVTVDLNHPLAGKTLQFEIELVGVTATTTTGA